MSSSSASSSICSFFRRLFICTFCCFCCFFPPNRRHQLTPLTPRAPQLFLLLFTSFLALSSVLVDGVIDSNNKHVQITESEEYQFTSVNPKCERIRIEMCSDIQYNMTIYPNLLKHAKQDEAEMEIKQYEMLVKVQCSADFKFFLCTLFTPVCTILNEPIPPCRHLCLSAKSGCEALMRKFGYQWPEIFDCNKMPESREGMCVGENNNEQQQTAAEEVEHAGSPNTKIMECPHVMKVLSSNSHSLLIANQSIEHCSLPCQSDTVVPTFFNGHIRHYLRLWVGAWAVTCCVCCAFTILTFLIDLERFEYPEKAILYMAICYLMVSACYMVGLVAEDSLSCAVSSATKQPLVTQGNENFVCSALAIVHYFFISAGALWWLILCFSWFLVTTLKWGEAPVGQVFARYFNGLAWTLPAVGAALMLRSGDVDGDLFTGICSLGNLRSGMLLNLAILPQTVTIGIGLLLFACGFISIMRIRSYIKGHHRFIAAKVEQAADASEKLSRLMFRIGCFSSLYVLPMAVGIGCTFYQAENMPHWLTNWYSTRCLHALRGAFGFTQSRELCPIGVQMGNNNQPMPLLFFLKYMAHFSTGIACVVWTLNGKTVANYGEFFARIFFPNGARRGRPVRVPTRPPN